MRKLKLQMQLSLDGFVAGPNGEMDWMVWDWDEKLKDYVKDITRPIDTILLGRKLAEGFIPAWESRAADPATADEFTHKMNETTRVVFSKTLHSIEWNHAVLAKKDLAEEIRDLKQQEGGDIVA